MLLNVIGALIGCVLGSVLSFGLLYGGFYLLSFFIKDHSAFGWVWILYLLIVPFGALLGLVLGYINLGKVLHNVF